jgi:acyl-CoA synthetase (AMP-forming)/AMP-acid ligase II
MTASSAPERAAIGSSDDTLTFLELAEQAARIGAYLSSRAGDRVGLVDVNSKAVPLALFGAAAAGKPLAPVNYRLSSDRLREMLSRLTPMTLIADADAAERVAGLDGVEVIRRDELLKIAYDGSAPLADLWEGTAEDPAVLLHTSGTSGPPKVAVLRHRHIASYILSTVDHLGATEEECSLVSVPPYHIAGISAVLSSTYSGRRVVYLESFAAPDWVELASQESVTHAMVVPTMLSRILDVLERRGSGLPALRNLAYGGGPISRQLIERAMRLLPNVDFVNAYGLTETSSTIAALTPDDHREAFASDSGPVRARLGSVGRPMPSVEISIRGTGGVPLPPGEIGEVWARGAQVAGDYMDKAAADEEGWFATRDAGHLDDDGYLFVHGRLDDVIVRGGENLSPGDVEDALLSHSAVADAAVVGITDVEWGQKVAAAVVLRDGHVVSSDELREHVRGILRSAMTPDVIEIRSELPYSDVGKLLRRKLRDELMAAQ